VGEREARGAVGARFGTMHARLFLSASVASARWCCARSARIHILPVDQNNLLRALRSGAREVR